MSGNHVNHHGVRSEYLSVPDGAPVDKTKRCPNCDSLGMKPLYRVRNVPVHSCILMPTRDAAINYPRGNIDLHQCLACGFVSNTSFDGSVQEYSTKYEETQGFSPTFNKFAKKLAGECIEKYQLKGKTCLEIGCGKGEFLVLLCEMGPSSGIGIDPAYVPERMKSQAADRIQFIQDFYGPSYTHLKADFVCCRHTLEHIPDTLAFMKLIRQAIGEQLQTDVFFEVPDATTTVLLPLGFWDVYYEHCSYFSPGSMGKVYRLAGYEPSEIWRDYGEQYLLIGGRPINGISTGKPAGLEDDVELVCRQAEQFRVGVDKRIKKWKSLIEDEVSRGKRVAIWGSGSKGVSFLTTLDLDDSKVAYAVDINPYKRGKFMPGTGQRIVGPQDLPGEKPDVVIVMNPIYCDEIRRDLDRLGISADLFPVEDATADSESPAVMGH